eukprot:5148533-Amphidinium_carterae.1
MAVACRSTCAIGAGCHRRTGLTLTYKSFEAPALCTVQRGLCVGRSTVQRPDGQGGEIPVRCPRHL